MCVSLVLGWRDVKHITLLKGFRRKKYSDLKVVVRQLYQEMKVKNCQDVTNAMSAINGEVANE